MFNGQCYSSVYKKKLCEKLINSEVTFLGRLETENI